MLNMISGGAVLWRDLQNLSRFISPCTANNGSQSRKSGPPSRRATYNPAKIAWTPACHFSPIGGRFSTPIEVFWGNAGNDVHINSLFQYPQFFELNQVLYILVKWTAESECRFSNTNSVECVSFAWISCAQSCISRNGSPGKWLNNKLFNYAISDF